ncbi:hypothetical protein AB6A40_009122 [Gnathostoma spinigerum]|uniref:Uncharacterized protein n=1 Tax=Gnathostoma spinigerum TaxID=75299 RepID=A0ABD6ERE8_9BILA
MRKNELIFVVAQSHTTFLHINIGLRSSRRPQENHMSRDSTISMVALLYSEENSKETGRTYFLLLISRTVGLDKNDPKDVHTGVSHDDNDNMNERQPIMVE